MVPELPYWLSEHLEPFAQEPLSGFTKQKLTVTGSWQLFRTRQPSEFCCSRITQLMRTCAAPLSAGSPGPGCGEMGVVGVGELLVLEAQR